MQKYAATPHNIDAYFAVEMIKKSLQTHFVNTNLKPLAIHNAVRRTLDDTAQIKIKNDGDVPLQFYLSAYENGVVGAMFVTIAPHTIEIHPIIEFGDVATFHYLNVYNPSPNLLGNYILDIVYLGIGSKFFKTFATEIWRRFFILCHNSFQKTIDAKNIVSFFLSYSSGFWFFIFKKKLLFYQLSQWGR